MRKKTLKQQIRNLLFGESEEAITRIWILTESGEKKLHAEYPNTNNLDVVVDSGATAETFLKFQRNVLSSDKD